MMKKKTAASLKALALLLLSAGALTGCGSGSGDRSSGSQNSSGEDNKLYVYNWGEYIDESVMMILKKRQVSR